MDLMFILKERHGRGNKEMARIVLPTTPRIGEWFRVEGTGRLMKVRAIITNLWPSGNKLAVETRTTNSQRPYGELILGAPTKTEKKEIYGVSLEEVEEEVETEL